MTALPRLLPRLFVFLCVLAIAILSFVSGPALAAPEGIKIVPVPAVAL